MESDESEKMAGKWKNVMEISGVFACSRQNPSLHQSLSLSTQKENLNTKSIIKILKFIRGKWMLLLLHILAHCYIIRMLNNENQFLKIHLRYVRGLRGLKYPQMVCGKKCHRKLMADYYFFIIQFVFFMETHKTCAYQYSVFQSLWICIILVNPFVYWNRILALSFNVFFVA